MTMQMPRSITMYTDKPLYLDNLHDRCSEVKEKMCVNACVGMANAAMLISIPTAPFTFAYSA